MANTDNAHGLIPIKHRLGAPLNAVVNPYYVPASYGTAMFIGDPVVKTGTSNTATEAVGSEDYLAGMLPEVNVATAGGVISGVCVGKRNDVSDLETIHNPASTEAIVMVCDDPNVVFRIKEDSVGGALAATSVGLNADLILTVAGDAITGISGCELDSSTAATTAALNLKILRLSDVHDAGANARNAIGADAKWDVIINEHTEVNGVAGI